VRILHLADLHIGVENYGHFDAAKGMHTRLMDFLARLDEAIDYGIEADVDLVLIAGDMFKNRDPQPRHQREFANRIRRLYEANIPVLMIIGNHDTAPGKDTANSVSVYEGLQYPGVTIAKRLEVYRGQGKTGPVAVICVPWLMREIFVSNNEDLRNAALSDQETVMINLVERYIQDHVAILQREDSQRPIIVAFHGTVSGAINGFERQLTLGKDVQLPQSVLAPAGVDYVALGHIHKHQVLRQQPPIVYPGSIERIDFGEINEKAKGCVLVEFEGRTARWTFKPLTARAMEIINLDLTTMTEQLTERVELAIERNPKLKDAIVAVHLTLHPEQKALLSLVRIRHKLEQAGVAYIARIVRTTPEEQRAREADVTREADIPTPTQALNRYLRRTNYQESELDTLLSLGNQIIDTCNDALST
jgi:exonuclease SbcD